ncbi:MAG: response regulator [Alphaproteobacteria bacterium]
MGKRLLVVEDEYLVATDLACALEAMGVMVVGPAGTVEDALDLVESDGGRLDGAVLDINLRGERVYPVADALTARGVPFVFATGYDMATVPETYAQVPRCEKPVDRARLTRLLSLNRQPR